MKIGELKHFSKKELRSLCEILLAKQELLERQVKYFDIHGIKELYSVDEVSELLQTQRHNCGVAIHLLEDCDTDTANVAYNAPEPGQWRKTKLTK